jgi:hypothetical protein
LGASSRTLWLAALRLSIQYLIALTVSVITILLIPISFNDVLMQELERSLADDEQSYSHSF